MSSLRSNLDSEGKGKSMTRDTDDLQQADEEAKLARCVELYKLAENEQRFNTKDLIDLQHFLGIESVTVRKTTWRRS